MPATKARPKAKPTFTPMGKAPVLRETKPALPKPGTVAFVSPHATAYNRLKRLCADHRATEAEVEARRLLRQYPQEPLFHAALGFALVRSGRWPEAAHAFRFAVNNAPRTLPPLAEWFAYLADILRTVSPTAALDVITQADRLGLTRGEYKDAFCVSASNAFIAMGDYLQGWPLFRPLEIESLSETWKIAGVDYTSDVKQAANPLPFAGRTIRHLPRDQASHLLLSRRLTDAGMPRWSGQRLDGKTVVVFTEWGIGDVLQWIRYLPAYKAVYGAAKVILLCHWPLLRVFQSMPNFAAYVDEAGELNGVIDPSAIPACDCWAQLLDTTYYLDRDNMLSAVLPWEEESHRGRYFQVEQAEADRWKARLEELEQGVRPLRIGCVWAAGSTNDNGKKRCFPARLFAPLATITSQVCDRPGVRLYGLQKGPQATEAADVPGMVSLSEEFTDFAETAGILQNLDLLITPDTSIAHLSGAIGRPMWLVLPFDSDWRWGEHDKPSRLYPYYTRKFYQTVNEDWTAPFAEIEQNIRDFQERNT